MSNSLFFFKFLDDMTFKMWQYIYQYAKKDFSSAKEILCWFFEAERSNWNCEMEQNHAIKAEEDDLGTHLTFVKGANQ